MYIIRCVFVELNVKRSQKCKVGAFTKFDLSKHDCQVEPLTTLDLKHSRKFSFSNQTPEKQALPAESQTAIEWPHQLKPNK